ncbi:MAG: cupin domain-containing protein [Myxococcales bacterium]|nr:cupin domain-containing protein [Myxococcales bacterium]
MPYENIDFDALTLTPGAHPLETKRVPSSPGVVRLEFLPGFVDPQVCLNGHVIYVIDGELTLHFDEATERVRAGQACVIEPGTGHRAANESNAPVTLLVVRRT